VKIDEVSIVEEEMSKGIVKPDPLEPVRLVCATALERRIAEVDALLGVARICVDEHDYLQAAVRLEEAGKLGRFTETEMNTFDAVSRKESL
jgi:hypothetical protein